MIDVCCKGRTLVAAISGEIDQHSAGEIKAAIDGAYARQNARDIILDFSAVTFMDSSGIGMIIGRYKNAAQMGGSVCVAGLGGELLRIFTLSGLPKIIKAFGTVSEALGEGERL